ncbi:unnamed protein product [Brassica oleracea var. botrytis]|uniref:(rape) hypothetical protein n=1 Tax=Brassica napus TaxID=3708 RepID=A0A816J0F6_BRANA|nr:unnamed protein product [Brassica napus]
MSCGEDWRKEARHSPLAMAFHGDRIAYQPLKSDAMIDSVYTGVARKDGRLSYLA